MDAATLGRRLGWVVFGSLASVLPLHAADWYVDAVNGSNANSGATPAQPWRTLTHAIASMPPGTVESQTLHVAPGVYGPQLGEVLPLEVPAGVWILGSAGSANTIVEGAAPWLIRYSAATNALAWPTGAEGLTLRGSDRGVVVSGSTNGITAPSFRDLVIEGMQIEGVLVAAGASFFDHADAQPSFTRTTISGCPVGVNLAAGTTSQLESATATVNLLDCSLLLSGLDGLRLYASGNAMTFADLTRCRVVGSGRDGVRCEPSAQMESVRARACLFADNQGAGLWCGAGFGGLWLYDCTVAHNAAAGVHTANGHSADVHNSVVAANGDDVELGGPLYATWSDSADGGLLGQAHCIAADPSFVDVAAGDYRLRWGSPCIDRGDPGAVGGVDLLGHARAYDGDLDTHAANDMGAFEFEPLHAGGVAHSGGSLDFEAWGEGGAHSRLLLSRLPQTQPQLTPFGAFSLLRPRTICLLTLPIGPPAPARFTLRVPDTPGLVGTTLSLQALTMSTAAPRGRALTNPVSVLVEP